MDRQLRAIVFDDHENLLDMLKEVLEDRGYEVLCYTDPTECLLHHTHDCQCDHSQVCCDILISDIDMPNASGLTHVEQQLRKGCKVPHIAIMSGVWTQSKLQKAKELGCATFKKPFSMHAFTAWLQQCEANSNRPRSLSDWFCK